MKELVTSWILLFAMVILFFVNSYTVTTVSDDMFEKIENLSETIEIKNLSIAETEMKNMRKKWKKDCKKLLHIFPHIQLEEIERLMILTETHIRNKEISDAVLRLKEIKHRIVLLVKNEKITLDNIF